MHWHQHTSQILLQLFVNGTHHWSTTQPLKQNERHLNRVANFHKIMSHLSNILSTKSIEFIRNEDPSNSIYRHTRHFHLTHTHKHQCDFLSIFSFSFIVGSYDASDACQLQHVASKAFMNADTQISNRMEMLRFHGKCFDWMTEIYQYLWPR